MAAAERPSFDLIFDADDTLWDSNVHFLEAEETFVTVLARAGVSAEREAIAVEVRRSELAIIKTHGYGRKPYVLALHQACEALGAHDGEIRAEVERIGAHLMDRHCALLPGVEAALRELAQRHRLLLFTKGQREEQLGKLERSGLAPLFSRVEVPVEKDAAAYRRLIGAAGLDVARTFMIGNSPRSDINPALAVGLRAVFIPHPHTWILERETVDLSDTRVTLLPSFPLLREMF